jgi:GntR family transcriptional regulator, transcriptional repressor for pyruvate dehydrogenase complex
MRFSRVENTHAYRSIVDQVCDAILRGDLGIDDWLPSERELAEQTGLSRSSVRQAIEVLSIAGIVKVKPGGGGGAQIVNELIPTELLGVAMATTEQQLIDVVEVRNLLEVGAAQLAVSRGTEAQITELESIIDRTEASVRDDPNNKGKWLRLDIAFHHAVIRMTHNEFLLRTYTSTFRRLLQISDMASMSEFANYGPQTMRLLLAALRRRDPLGAQMAIYQHVYPIGSILRRYLDTEGSAATNAAQPASIIGPITDPDQHAEGMSEDSPGSMP